MGTLCLLDVTQEIKYRKVILFQSDYNSLIWKTQETTNEADVGD